MEVLILFVVALALIVLGLPIAVALGGTAVIILFYYQLAPATALPALVFSTTSKFTLLAVPFFMAAGFLMERSGIAERLVRLASLIVGRLPGGLAYVAIITSVLFAGMSGSGTADTAALGSILLPTMNRAGYKREFSAALLACGGSIGILIPPSISYVLYGAITGASIGKLFIAGIVPGLMVAVALAVPSYFATRNADLPGWERGTPREVVRGFGNAALGLAAPVIILGGIYAGLFTPTEAAGIVVAYAFLVGVVFYRSLRFREIVRFFSDAGMVTSMAMVVVVGASLFSWVATRLGASETISSAMSSASSHKLVTVLLLSLMLLVAGMFLDAVSITFVFVPLFLPILQAAGIDLVWFGIIYSLTMAIGQVHPPVGVNLYISAGLADAQLGGATKAVLPLIGMEVIVLLLIIFFPSISLWLPNHL